LEELGRGGMGVVYKARQLVLNRLVALKMILAGELASPEQRLRFRLEAEMAARVRAPKVVQVYEVGEHQGRPFLAMELVEGGNLARRLAGRPLPPWEAAALVEVLARAVHTAHQHGVVHRDLKPANILLQKKSTTESTDHTEGKKERSSSSVSSVLSVVDCVPKVTDFGLARPVEARSCLTRTVVLVGTPEFMASEQVALSARDVGP